MQGKKEEESGGNGEGAVTWVRGSGKEVMFRLRPGEEGEELTVCSAAGSWQVGGSERGLCGRRGRGRGRGEVSLWRGGSDPRGP